MNKENKRPPFTTYVRCRHTGTSPFKPNLGLPTVKPKRATVNAQQERIPQQPSRIPQPTQNRRLAQKEPRPPVQAVRNVHGRGRLARNDVQEARRVESNDSAPLTVSNVPDTVGIETVEATPIVENNENVIDAERIESVEAVPLVENNENVQETERRETLEATPLVENDENVEDAEIHETVEAALPKESDENVREVIIESVDAVAVDENATDVAPSAENVEYTENIVRIEAAPLAETVENFAETSFPTEADPLAQPIENESTTESAPQVANEPFPEIPLLMEVNEDIGYSENPLRYSLCHETQNTYRMKLSMESLRLSKLADLWEKIKCENELESDIQDDIDAAVGQTRLLLRSKFDQFKGLIDLYPTSNNIRPGDLGGFWDMIYIQVELLDSHYEKLQKLKDNNWIVEMPQVQAKKKTKRGGKKKKNLKVKSKFREVMARKNAENNTEEPSSSSVCPLPPGSPCSNETFSQEVPRELVKTPRVNRIIERARRSRRSSIGIVIRSSLTGKLF